jgi:molybdate transport system permease protein
MLKLTPDEWTAILLSLRVSIVATVFALPFGIGLGWLLARKAFWGKTLVDGIVYLPLVLPPVVTGYLLLISFGRRGPLGAFFADHFGLVFSFRWTGAALACGVMGFPLMVRSIRLVLEAIDRRLEDAAATLGADRFRVFLTITLPLALPGIIAGAVLCFARASASSGLPSPSCPTFRARRRPSPPPFIRVTDSRRRGRRRTTRARCHCVVASCAGRFQVVCPPCRDALPG